METAKFNLKYAIDLHNFKHRKKGPEKMIMGKLADLLFPDINKATRKAKLSRIGSGKSKINPDLLVSISKTLDLPMDELFQNK